MCAYIGGKLRPWFGVEPTRKTVRRLAEKGGSVMLEYTVKNTPIDDSPEPSRPPGTMRRKWKQKSVEPGVSIRGAGWESGVETDDPIAHLIEHGWGLWGPRHSKYLILPRGPWPLSWVDRATGQRRFASHVWHPGAPGQHMVLIASHMAEHKLPEFARPILERWAKETERQNKSDRGIAFARFMR
jgi:hypothetical protein